MSKFLWLFTCNYKTLSNNHSRCSTIVVLYNFKNVVNEARKFVVCAWHLCCTIYAVYLSRSSRFMAPYKSSVWTVRSFLHLSFCPMKAFAAHSPLNRTLMIVNIAVAWNNLSGYNSFCVASLTVRMSILDFHINGNEIFWNCNQFGYYHALLCCIASYSYNPCV